MICPRCRTEYRPGFTRCSDCGTDLVPEAGDGTDRQVRAPESDSALRGGMLVDYCGFFSLTDARQARDELRSASVRCEIVIREPQNASLAAPVQEEYWIRVAPQDFGAAAPVLGYESSETEESEAEEVATCSACGSEVDPEASVCPSCGASFED